MSEKDNLEGLLYGKPLQSLITTALIRLQEKNVENDILISTVIDQFLLNRPELNEFLKTPRKRKHLRVRVTNSIKQMSKTKLVKIKLQKTENINYQYIIITPNLL